MVKKSKVARAKKAPMKPKKTLAKPKKALAKTKKAPAKPTQKVKARAKPTQKVKARAKPTQKVKARAKPTQTSVTAVDSYAPFTIADMGATVRLSFFDWAWLEKQHGSIEVDGYYMNGPAVEGLVRAVMFASHIASDEVEGDSEGDACLLYFTDVKLATRVAQLAAAMIKDRAQLAKTIEIAREHGFED